MDIAAPTHCPLTIAAYQCGGAVRMWRRVIGRVAGVVCAVALGGCGQMIAAGTKGGPVPTPAVSAFPGTPTPSAPAAPSASPSSPPVVTITAQPPMTFAIMPLFPAGAAGTITVVLAGALVHYHVVVTGLVPRSAHTVHDHAGSCASGLTSRHLGVLAVVAADAHGVAVFDATVAAREFGRRPHRARLPERSRDHHRGLRHPVMCVDSWRSVPGDGLEPSIHGFTDRCLNQLGYPGGGLGYRKDRLAKFEISVHAVLNDVADAV